MLKVSALTGDKLRKKVTISVLSLLTLISSVSVSAAAISEEMALLEKITVRSLHAHIRANTLSPQNIARSIVIASHTLPQKVSFLASYGRQVVRSIPTDLATNRTPELPLLTFSLPEAKAVLELASELSSDVAFKSRLSITNPSKHALTISHTEPRSIAVAGTGIGLIGGIVPSEFVPQLFTVETFSPERVVIEQTINLPRIAHADLLPYEKLESGIVLGASISANSSATSKSGLPFLDRLSLSLYCAFSKNKEDLRCNYDAIASGLAAIPETPSVIIPAASSTASATVSTSTLDQLAKSLEAKLAAATPTYITRYVTEYVPVVGPKGEDGKDGRDGSDGITTVNNVQAPLGFGSYVIPSISSPSTAIGISTIGYLKDTTIENPTITSGTALNLSLTTPTLRSAVFNGLSLFNDAATFTSSVAISNLTATSSTLLNANVTNLTTTNATTTNAYVTNLVAASSTLTDLVATNATTTNLNVSTLTVGTSTGGALTLNGNLIVSGTTTLATTTITNATIDSLSLGTSTANAVVINGTLDVIGTSTLATTTVTDFVASRATSTSLFSTLFSAVTGFFTNLTATNATSTNLFSTNAFVTNATTTTIGGTNLNFTNGTTTNLFTQNLAVGNASTTGNQTIDGTLTVNGTTTIGSNTLLQGNVTLGTSTSNFITVNGLFNSHLAPAQNITYDLGTPSFYWRNGYLNTLNVNTLSAGSTTISGTNNTSFTINTGNGSSDAQDSSLVFFRGLVTPNAVLRWNSTDKRLESNMSFKVHNETPITGTTTLTVQAGAGQGSTNLFEFKNNAGSALSVFSANGWLGIGSSTPGSALTVIGNAYLGGNVTATGTLSVAGTSTLATTTITKLDISGAVDASSTLAVTGATTLYSTLNVSGQTTLVNASTTNLTVSNNAHFGGNTGIWNGSGNVGIGTTSPTAMLTVGGGTAAPSFAVLSNTTAAEWFSVGVGAPGQVQFNTQGGATLVGPNVTNQTSRFNITSGASSTKALSVYGVSGQTANIFEVSSSTGGNGDFFVVKSDGKVGIGTTTPVGNLSVAGSSTSEFSPVLGITNTASSGFIPGLVSLAPNLTTGQANYLSFGKALSNNNSGSLLFTYTGAGSTSNRLGFNFFGGSELMSVLASGNVGIGTTSPSTKLHVFASGTNPVAAFESTGSPYIDFFRTSASTLGFRIQNVGGSGYTTFGGNASGSQAMLISHASSGGAVNGGVGFGDTRAVTDVRAQISVIPSAVGNRGIHIQATSSQTADLFAVSSSSAAYPDTSSIGNFFVIKADGKVGIGTTSPVSELQVFDGSGTTADFIIGHGTTGSNATDGLRLRMTNSDAFLTNLENGTLGFGTNGATNMTILSGGNVGIGTTTPGSLLTMVGQSGTTNNLFTVASSSGASLVVLGVGGLTGQSYFNASNGETRLAINPNAQTFQVSAATPFSWSAGTNATATADTGLSRLSAGTVAVGTGANGNTAGTLIAGTVGIGTSTPTTKLDIVSSNNTTQVRLSDEYLDATIKDFILSGRHYTNSEEDFAVLSARSDSTSNTVYIGGEIANGLSAPGQNAATDIVFKTAANSTTTVGSERMRIASNGNVGIGTTSPSYKLAVQDPSGSNYAGLFQGAGGNGTALGGDSNGAVIQGKTISNGNASLLLQPNGGNVGIGTTTPGSKLFVEDTTPIISINSNTASTSARINFRDRNTLTSAITSDFASTTLNFFHNGITAMTVGSSGNVGIGTTTPGSLLSVQGNAYIGGNITATGTLTIGSNGIGSTYFSGTGWVTSGGNSSVALYRNGGSQTGLTSGFASQNVVASHGGVTFAAGLVGELSHTSGATDPGTAYGVLASFAGGSNSSTWGNTAALGTQYRFKAGTTTNAFGVRIEDFLSPSGAGTSTNTYGLYIGDVSPTSNLSQTNTPYGLYSSDTSANNYFAGRVGIGSSTPGATLAISSAVATSSLTQFQVDDGATGGYFALTEGVSGASAYIPTLVGRSAGVNGFGLSFLGEIPVAQDALFSTAGLDAAVVVNGRRVGAANLTAANVFNVRNNATSLMMISASGNTGLGTSSPATLLHLDSGGATLPVLTLSAAGGSVQNIGRASANFTGAAATDLGIKYTGNLYLGRSSSAAVLINSSDNVGIGTTTLSSEKLTVAGNITLSSSTPTIFAKDNFAIKDSDDSNRSRFIFSSNNQYDTRSSGAHAFLSGGSEKMRILATGNVGIGTTSPTARLGVVGAGTGTGLGFQVVNSGGTPVITSLDNGTVGIGTSSPLVPLHVNGSEIRLQTNNAFYSQYNTAGTRLGYLQWNSSSGNLLLQNEISTGHIVLGTTGGGNVGIGTTTPDSKLFVAASNATANTAITGAKVLLTDTGNLNGGDTAKTALSGTINATGTYGASGRLFTLQGLSGNATFSGTLNSGGNSDVLEVQGLTGIARFSGTVSNSSDSASLIGVSGVSSDNMGTNGFTAHYGGLFGSSGTADANYGVYVSSVADATNNYGLYINSVAAAAGNYALYSAAAAQSYFAGNVGIGTTSPAYKLDVNGDAHFTGGATLGNIGAFGTLNVGHTGASYTAITAGDPNTATNATGLYLRSTGSSPVGISSAGAPIGFFTGGPGTDERMRITSTGNIGIGTTTPQHKLVVAGQGQFASSSQVPDTGTASEGATTKIGYYSTGDYGYLIASHAGIAAKPLILNTNQNGSAANVGIGTTSPSGRLHVYNNGAASSQDFIIESSLSNADHGMSIRNASQNYSLAVRGSALSNSFVIRDITNGGDRLAITTAGNVGIGTSTPSAMLDVNGVGRFSGVASPTVGKGLELGYFAGGSTSFVTSYDRDAAAHRGMLIDGSSVAINANSGGNVGIGTTTPLAKLNISATDNTELLRLSSTGAPSLYHLKLTGVSGSTGDYRIQTVNNGTASDALYFKGDGKIGMGTTSPQGKLDVTSVAGNAGGLTVAGENIDAAAGYSLTHLQGTGKVLVGWNRSGGQGETDFISNRGVGSTGGFNFYDYSNGGVLTHLVNMSSSGNIGIGNTAPDAKLTVGDDPVSGDANFTSVVAAGGVSAIFSDNSNSALWIKHPLTGLLNFNVDSGNQITFSDGDVENMRIDGTGDIGIGTTTAAYSGSDKHVVIQGSSGANPSTLQVLGGNADSSLTLYSGNSAADNPSVIWQTGTALRFGVTNSYSGTAGYSEKMRMTSDGMFGIATTTNITESLVVNGAITSKSQSVNFSTGGVRTFMDMIDASKIARIGTVTGGDTLSGTQGEVSFYVKGNEAMRINASSNVGIGTTTPASKLHVNGTTTLGVGATTAGVLTFQNASNNFMTHIRSSSTQSASFTLTLPNDDGSTGQVLTTDGNGFTYWGSAAGLSGGQNGFLTRWTSASTIGTSTLMDNGTVAGVNATSSSYSFNVQGASGVNPFNVASSSGSSLLSVLANGVVNIPNSGSLGTTLVSANNIGNDQELILRPGATRGLKLQNWNGSAWVDGLVLASSTLDVGIGTSTPLSRLHVVGSGTTNPFTVASSSGRAIFQVLSTGNLAWGMGDGGTPSAFTIRGAQASGTNLNGANITFDASNGTGNGSSGAFVFRTAAVGTTSTFDTVTSSSTTSSVGSVSTSTWSHTVTSSGSNRILIVTAAFDGQTGTRPTAITYGAQSLTLLARATSSNGGTRSVSEMWYVLNPSTGANTVTVTQAADSSSGRAMIYSAMSFTAVNQSTPFGTPAYATTSSGVGSLTATVTADPGSLIPSVLSVDSNSVTISAVSPTTKLVDIAAGSHKGVAGVATSSAASTDITYSLSNNQRPAIVAVPLIGTNTTASNSLSEMLRVGTSTITTAEVNVGIGTTTPGARLEIWNNTDSTVDVLRIGSDVTSADNIVFRVESTGKIYADASATIGTPADVAESYAAVEAVDAGTVVAFATTTNAWSSMKGSATTTAAEDDIYEIAGVRKAVSASEAIGVVSTNPGLHLGADIPNGVPVALSGRVPVKITLENGDIKIGDYLTVSTSTPGYAMKFEGEGRVIGRAVSDSIEGRDKVMMIVENGYQKVNLASKTASTSIMLTTGNLDLDANGVAIINIKSLASANGTWSISEDGRITAHVLCLEDICIDKSTLTNILSSTGQSGVVAGTSTSSGETGTGATSTPEGGETGGAGTTTPETATSTESGAESETPESGSTEPIPSETPSETEPETPSAPPAEEVTPEEPAATEPAPVEPAPVASETPAPSEPVSPPEEPAA